MIHINTKIASVSILLLFLFSGMAYAQLGEVAGKVHFNVAAGDSQTLQMTIFDSSGNASLNFMVVNPNFQSVPNQATPAISVSPLNGTLRPQQYLTLNITVDMPSNATPGTFWSGVVEVTETSNGASSGGGAHIQTGIAKIITATALPAPVNYLMYAAVAGVAVVAIIGSIVYYFKVLKRRSAESEKKIIP